MTPGRRRETPAAERDQHESAFATILAELVMRVPGARAAALVDVDGETVDYWGRIGPYQLKLAAAHWRIVLHEMRGRESVGDATFVVIRATRASYLLSVLPDGYALVVVLARAAGFGGWRRAVAASALSLGAEAGWSWERARPATWFAVQVVCDEQGRPTTIRQGGRERTLDILGTVASGLGRRERGYRVRFRSGLEATLVRESNGAWYVDEVD